jgi:hypothetical protein
MGDQAYDQGNGNGEQYHEDAQGYQEQNFAPPEHQEQHPAGAGGGGPTKQQASKDDDERYALMQTKIDRI